MKQRLTDHQTDNLKEALITASGQKIKFRGRTWKLDCHEHTNRDGHYFFTCDAQNTTPQTPEEAKFCVTDLWKSDSDDSVKLLYRFALLGGFCPARQEFHAELTGGAQ